jgi:hypothetical protein
MPTTNKSLNTPANGSNINTWDVPVNANFTSLDTAFGGLTSLNATGISGNVTLTLAQYTPPNITITGTPAGVITYIVPAGVGGVWSVYNNTTAGSAIIYFSTTTSTSVPYAVPVLQGYRTQIISDGTNMSYTSTAPINVGGLTTQIQYNNSGFLGGSANFTFNGTTTVTLKGLLAFGGTTSGAISLQAPATAGTSTLTLPLGVGTVGQVLQTDGTGVLSWTSIGTSVTTFSAGSTGLTPSTATSGAVTLAGTLNVANGGTGVTTSTGSGSNVLSTSPTLVTPILGTPTSGSLVNCTFPTLNQNTTGTAAGLSSTLAVASGGTGVTTSTGTGSVVLSNSPTLVTPLLGTPTSGNFSTGSFTWPTFNQNTTGTAAGLSATLAVASGGTGVTTSTGTGNVVLSTSPTLVTPLLGTPTSGNFSTGSFTWPTFNQNTTGSSGSCTGNSATATLATTASTANAVATGVLINITAPSAKAGYTRTLSASAATGGSDGDIWYQY